MYACAAPSGDVLEKLLPRAIDHPGGFRDLVLSKVLLQKLSRPDSVGFIEREELLNGQP